MNRFRPLLLCVLLTTETDTVAFESDVHFGLTQWLALKAGFDPAVAKTIAIGNARVDSGEMQFMDLVYMYACMTKDDIGSRRAGEHHYPAAIPPPAAPEARAIVPGGDAAKKAVSAALEVPPGQAAYRLFKFGEALHLLQDSWSHQGVPDVPTNVGGSMPCDPARAWGHPKARGGSNSHQADLTRFWAADSVAMAKATYDALIQYPAIGSARRMPRSWEEIRPALDRFVAASTKSEKKAWFISQGIVDVDFLEGTSLKDGAQPFDSVWSQRNLPPLASTQSRQHEVPADLLDFYNRFFVRWVSGADFDAIAAEFGQEATAGDTRARGKAAVGTSKDELAARLKVWRLRDHGRVAESAHAIHPLNARERSTIDAAAKEPAALARYDPPADAFFPLLPRGGAASPLLPFFIASQTVAADQNPTAVAVTKFRHAPYDAVAVASEKIGGRWRIVSIFAVVDH